MVRNTHDRLLDHHASDLDTNVLVDGAIGGYISDGDTVHEALTAVVANVSATSGIALGRAFSTIAEECVFAAETTVYEGGITRGGSGSPALISAGNSVVGHPGIIQLTTGTSATGRCAMATNGDFGSILLGGGVIRFGATFRIVTLSDSSQRFSIRSGFGNTVASEFARGVFFRYADNVNSGKWERVTREAGVETANDTGITADTSWHTYEFEVNAAGTSVEFFIDGASVGSQSGDISATTLGLVPAFMFKSVGTTARTMLLDAYWFSQAFSSSR
jgi:hypothetical protein